MELHLTDPEALIEESWLNSYTQQIELIWEPIVELNTNLFILEKILLFPFNFFEMEHTLFWKTIKTTIYEKCLLIISNLTMDSLKNSITLPKLKNNIRRHLINDDARKILDRELKKLAFEATMKDLKSRIKNFRDRRLPILIKNGFKIEPSQK